LTARGRGTFFGRAWKHIPPRPMKHMASPYNQEHLETLMAVRAYLERMPAYERRHLLDRAGPYLDFRREVAAFQAKHFSEVCTVKCFRDRSSACCAREGIMAFFADVVINGLLATPEELDALMQALQASVEGPQCVYLGENGCLWHLKPIVCEMFLCDHAVESVLEPNEERARRWRAFREQEKRFTWPDRPVLFDELEADFMAAGLDSPLMYCHKSPGLVRVKKKAGFRGKD